MPNIKSYTPAWLTKAAPGHNLFAATTEDLRESAFSPYASKKKSRSGPRRTIARRGTEVFVAVNREIRWADLVYLKEQYEEKTSSRVRVKRERSVDSSFDIYDEEQNGTEDLSGAAEGLRVSRATFIVILQPHTDFLCVYR